MRRALPVVAFGALALAVVPAHAAAPPAKIECSSLEGVVNLLLTSSGKSYQHGPYKLWPVNGDARITSVRDGNGGPLLDVKLLVTQVPSTTIGGLGTVFKTEKGTNDSIIHSSTCAFIRDSQRASGWMLAGSSYGKDIAKTANAPASATMTLDRTQRWQNDYVFITAAWGDPTSSGSQTPIKLLFQR
jgi:hypothetical protein